MDRKQFLTSCGLACASGGLLVLLQQCASANMVNGIVEGSDLVVPIAAFEYEQGGKVQTRNYLVVQEDKLEYPICVYRVAASGAMGQPATYQYHALWMRCTHQGTELQALGDKLHCPAHGSEFGTNGAVENGPAVDALRKFEVKEDNNNLRISLK